MLLYSLFNYAHTQSQISNFKDKFELPIEVKETSGLRFLDVKIITHNDSGDAPTYMILIVYRELF